MRSEPTKAVATLGKAILLAPDSIVPRTRQLLALISAADLEGQRQACSLLFDRFGKTANPFAANAIAWSCALAPAAISDHEALVRLAEIAVNGCPTEWKHDALNTLGAALYRSGRFGDAIRRLEEAIKARNGAERPNDWPLLAMAHHRLGHNNEARRWLDRLRNRRLSDDPDGFWEELENHILCSEAEAVILYDPVFPSDPFAH